MHPSSQRDNFLSIYKKLSHFMWEFFAFIYSGPPPSHSRNASLIRLAPFTSCFGRFRLLKTKAYCFQHRYPYEGKKEVRSQSSSSCTPSSRRDNFDQRSNTKNALLCRAFFIISSRITMIALRQVISLDWLRQVMSDCVALREAAIIS